MQKKLVIIGANDFQNQLVLKAKSMGFETHCFAWEEDAAAKETADFFYPVSITEKEKILERCREIQPNGICSIASDLAILTVDYVSERLGLPGNSYKDTVTATNKFRMRQAFAGAGVRVPKFLSVNIPPEETALAGFSYPLIVKPTDRSGSRCITKVFSFPEIAAAVKAAVDVSFEHRAIIEEYITGKEYSCECISFHGEHHFLAFTQKFTTGAPHFIETGHKQPSDIPHHLQPDIIAEVYRALTALHIQNGASHTEFMLDAEGGFRIIETGPRMGGDCIGSDLVYLSTGHDFMKMVIDVACGRAPEFNDAPTERPVEIRFLFDRKDLERLKELQKTAPESAYRVSEIDESKFGQVSDSGSRAGYYIIVDRK